MAMPKPVTIHKPRPAGMATSPARPAISAPSAHATTVAVTVTANMTTYSCGKAIVAPVP